MSRIVAGGRPVLEALSGPRAAAIVVVYVTADCPNRRDVERVAAERRVRVEERVTTELDVLAKGVRHQGVVAIGGEYSYANFEEVLAEAPRPALLVALDEITDPHNLGAIVRSAVAFGADAVITLKDRASPVTPVVVRASAGATEHARIARVVNLSRALDACHDEGLVVVGLDADGSIDVDALPPAPEGRVLVVGSEGHGIRRLVRTRCDVVARIPLPGPLASLNASVAAGIALAAAARQRHAPG